MSETKTVNDRLLAVQGELKAPRDQNGRFGAHRSAESILTHANPLLRKHGLALVLSDSIEQVGDRNYVVASATIYTTNGASISATASAWEGELSRGLDAPQVTGSASSYARKYALQGLFAIDDGSRDPDAHDEPAEPSKAPARKPAVGSAPVKATDALATTLQKNQIRAFLTGMHIAKDDMVAFLEDNFGIIPGSDMTHEDAGNIIKELREWRANGGES